MDDPYSYSYWQVAYWPDIAEFRNKLKFQIALSLFRTKITRRDTAVRDGRRMEEVLSWYNDINTRTLSWVTYTVKESDVSDFYRYIIGYKELFSDIKDKKKHFTLSHMLVFC